MTTPVVGVLVGDAGADAGPERDENSAEIDFRPCAAPAASGETRQTQTASELSGGSRYGVEKPCDAVLLLY